MCVLILCTFDYDVVTCNCGLSVINKRICYVMLCTVSLYSQVLAELCNCIAKFVVKGVGHFKRKFQVGGDIAHQPLLVSEN